MTFMSRKFKVGYETIPLADRFGPEEAFQFCQQRLKVLGLSRQLLILIQSCRNSSFEGQSHLIARSASKRINDLARKLYRPDIGAF